MRTVAEIQAYKAELDGKREEKRLLWAAGTSRDDSRFLQFSMDSLQDRSELLGWVLGDSTSNLSTDDLAKLGAAFSDISAFFTKYRDGDPKGAVARAFDGVPEPDGAA